MRFAQIAIAFLLLTAIVGACSSKDADTDAIPDTSEAVEEPLTPGHANPPLISDMPPQPPGPEPQRVASLPPPALRMPVIPEDNEGKTDMVTARAMSQFYAMDNRSPIVNGNFERWEKPGPINWHGIFTYKKPGDPPKPDLQMFPSTWDGKWALRFMPTGTYVELYQDVKLPELEGAAILDAIAYVRNPIPQGFAIRLTYVANGAPQVTEVYPLQTDGSWTYFHARIELPQTVAAGSIRLYLTRDPQVKDSVIVDGLSVRVVGATGSGTPPSA